MANCLYFHDSYTTKQYAFCMVVKAHYVRYNSTQTLSMLRDYEGPINQPTPTLTAFSKHSVSSKVVFPIH